MLIQVEMPSSSKPKLRRFNVLFALGFRPLYLLSSFWAVVSVLLWIFAPHLLRGMMPAMYWHAHEMLWGFIVTVAVAFMLTAGATWTNRNPLKPWALAVLSALWICARLGYLLPGKAMFIMAGVAETAFFLWAAYALARVLIQAKSKQNYPLVLALLALAATNLAYLCAVYQQGFSWIIQSFHIGMLLMAFIALLVARRVIPFFASRRMAGLDIPRHEKSGKYQLMMSALAVLLLLLSWHQLAALALLVVTVITWFQLYQWQPWAIRKEPLLWVLYISYFMLGLGVLFAALYFVGVPLSINARSASFVHMIGMGGFSVMIIGMLTRTALGHTGRPLKAGRLMVTSYVFVILATVFRLIALWSGNAMGSLHLSATLWIIAFACYLWQFAPILTSPRADGRPG